MMILDPQKGSMTIQHEGKGRPLGLKGAHDRAGTQELGMHDRTKLTMEWLSCRTARQPGSGCMLLCAAISGRLVTPNNAIAGSHQ